MKWPVWLPWPQAWLRAFVLFVAVGVSSLFARVTIIIGAVFSSFINNAALLVPTFILLLCIPGVLVWLGSRSLPPVVRDWLDLKRKPWVEGLIAVGVLLLSFLLTALLLFGFSAESGRFLAALIFFGERLVQGRGIAPAIWFCFAMAILLYHLEFLFRFRAKNTPVTPNKKRPPSRGR